MKNKKTQTSKGGYGTKIKPNISFKYRQNKGYGNRYRNQNPKPKPKVKLVLPVQLTNVPANYYDTHYKDTDNIPKTSIINYLFSNYTEFTREKALREEQNKYIITFADCFVTDDTDFSTGLQKETIQKSFSMNPSMSLDKFIAYSFYITQKSIFTSDDGLSIIKSQIGKDIRRIPKDINGSSFTDLLETNGLLEEKGPNGDIVDNYQSKVADLYYQTIIENLAKINKGNVNLNIVNKIALLSCQNIINVFTDLISMKLNDILAPEINSVFKNKMTERVIINDNAVALEIEFQSLLLISQKGEPMNPEYPCGNLAFVLRFDFLKNVYELKTFALDYDLSKCGPETGSETGSEIGDTRKGYGIQAKYAIPATLITAGIIATPFLLTALGGKKSSKNKNNKKTTKTINNKTKKKRIRKQKGKNTKI